MNYNGYMGKILYVNLTNRSIHEEELDINLAESFIGDFGINAKLAYDLIKPGIETLSMGDPIIIGAGPLAGTLMPGASRCTAWSKWPVSSTIGPAGGPMNFGGNLKYAGYDHLVVTGKSNTPVYIKISDEDVEICDAGYFWGRDTYETTDKLWAKYGIRNSVISIGEAGENIVKISLALIDKQGSIGRFGLGALMGSKKLKAIITGGKKRVQIYNHTKFLQLIDEMLKEVRDWPLRDELLEKGYMGLNFDRYFYSIVIPNYPTDQNIDIETSRKKFGPNIYQQKIKKARLACPGCPTACRDIEQIREGEYVGQIAYHQSFTHNYPIKLKLKSAEEGANYLDLCERFGIDKMAVTQGMGFLNYLNEQGIIPKKELEGFEFGNWESTRNLLKKTVYKQGIGGLLADGREGFVKRVGTELVETLGHYIKGADCWINPRSSGFSPMQLDLALNPMGPISGKGGFTRMRHSGAFIASSSPGLFKKFARRIGIPEEKIFLILDSPFKINIGRHLRHSQDFFAICSSLGLCLRAHLSQFYYIDKLADLYSAVTGIEKDTDQLKKAGERAWNMLAALNVREGQSREDAKFPKIAFNNLKIGDKEFRMKDQFGIKYLTEEDIEQIKNDYYNESGWEQKRGIPTKDTLARLGLVDVAEDFKNRGIFDE